jgi:nucleoside-diphosphate-sugar epimerase
MKVFVAGGSGAVGTRLVPALVKAGHDVVATTRSAGNTDRLRELGAEPVVLDGLDREATIAAVRDSAAEVVVHQLTSLSGATNFRRFDREFALTNRLRTEGTDNLLTGARAAGARRFVAQSFAGWPYAREGGAVKTEDDPLDPDPPKGQRETLAAIRHLEAAVVGAGDLEGIALRYGGFYGPGNALGNGGYVVEQVRKRRVPIVGDGAGVWSFLHIDDAAGAVVAALERGAPGVYNVVDDEPARVSEWLPHLAQVIGAPPPRRVPVWLGRLAAGEVGVSMMTRIRGASNAKAKRALGWQPTWPTWRDGFRRGLG